MNYQRLVQWSAGPIAIIAGWLATTLVNNVPVFGALHASRNSIAHAIVIASTFIVSTGVTYAAHHKWLTNLAAWWVKSGIALPAGAFDAPAEPVSPAPAPPPPPSLNLNDLREQLKMLEAKIGDGQTTPAPQSPQQSSGSQG